MSEILFERNASGVATITLNRMIRVNAAALALHEVTKPAIAKVNGDAVGAGMNLALGCDLVVAAESARFSGIFARRGLSLDFGGSWLLPRLVGMHKAKALDAEAAGQSINLVSEDTREGVVASLEKRKPVLRGR